MVEYLRITDDYGNIPVDVPAVKIVNTDLRRRRFDVGD